MELPIFDLAAIVNAIDNFSNNNKLGEGGFGPVYKVNNNIERRTIYIYIYIKIISTISFRVYYKRWEI
jgi:hypothetical protein